VLETGDKVLLVVVMIALLVYSRRLVAVALAWQRLNGAG
jgi:hypothetical protein